MSGDVRHHAHLMTTGRHGSWCSCPCGWSSGTYGTVVGAHLAFGRHLVSAEHIRHSEPSPTLAARRGTAETGDDDE